MKAKLIKLKPIEPGKFDFDGEMTVIQIDDTPGYIKSLQLFEDGRILYSEANDGVFTHKANFEV